MLHFINARLCDEGKLQYGDLYVDPTLGTIVASAPPDTKVTTIDLKGQILAPGFIDIQNNGVYGLNFSLLGGASTDAEIRQFEQTYDDVMAKYLATGVTLLCPTVTLSFPDVYAKVLPVYARSRNSHATDSLGAHLEGPFISPHKKGCHPVETFVDAERSSFEAVYGAENLRDNVAILTAAPEIPGVLANAARLPPTVVFSVGHTALDRATCVRAVQQGASMVTHLYNAMPQPHHRDTGVVGLVLEPATDRHPPYFGLICDGVHVAPAMCVLAYRASPARCVLTTDAMHLIGLPDGTYEFGQQHITKHGVTLKLKGTDTLAGAATTLAECVRNLVRWASIPLAQAVQTVTNNAAASLRIGHKGTLRAGADADLVVLDDAGHVLDVYKLGHRVAKRTAAL